MSVLSVLAAEIAVLQARQAVLLPQVQIDAQAGKTAATSTAIAEYEANAASLIVKQAFHIDATAEAADLAAACAADVIAETNWLVSFQAALDALGLESGSGIALNRAGGARASRLRELTGSNDFGAPQTNPQEAFVLGPLAEAAEVTAEGLRVASGGVVEHVQIRVPSYSAV